MYNKNKIIKKNSLLSKNESTAIKGVVMLLIVLGHINLLGTYTDMDGVTRWYSWWRIMYKCHVFVFFILPFIYGSKDLDTKGIYKHAKRDFIRMYVPYIWFFIICFLIFLCMGGDNDMLVVLHAFIVGGSQPLLEAAVNVRFLWFMPVMAMLLLWRNLWFNKITFKGKVIVSAISFCMAGMGGVMLEPIINKIPFSIGYVFIYMWSSILSRFILDRFKDFNRWYTMGVFISLALLYIFLGGIGYDTILNFVIQICLPTSFFLLLFSIRKWIAKFNFIKSFGMLSFQIYLIHLFIYQALVMLCKYYDVDTTLFLLWGGIQYIITLIVSYYMARFIQNNKIVNRLLFCTN